jgi:hypothetical protein
MRTSFVRACTEPAPRGFVDRRISLLHLRGVAWARVGEFVGQRNLAVTATTYSHVLLDETEVDYAALLTERPRRAENSQIRARLCCPGAVPGSRRTWQRGAVTVVAPPDGDLVPDNDPDWRVECTLRAPLTGPGYAGGASATVGAYGGDASETTLPIVFRWQPSQRRPARTQVPSRGRLGRGWHRVFESEGCLRRGERDPSRIARLAQFAGVDALSAELAALEPFSGASSDEGSIPPFC